MKTMSVKEARENFAYATDTVAKTKKAIIITKFGKPSVKIVPVTQEDLDSDKNEQVKKALDKSFGMWKDRKDYEFKREGSRYGKIFD